MRKIMIIILAAVAMTVSSCRIETVKDKGDLKSKNVEVKDFRNITVAGGFDVEFTQSDSISVRVEATEELLDMVSIESDGRTLIIKNKEKNENHRAIFVMGGSIGESEPVKVFITAPSLDELTVSGSASFDIEKSLATEKLKITLTGSGEVEIDGVKCQSADLVLIGSGDIRLRPIEAETLNATIAGSGIMQLHTINIKKIDASITGSGDIFFACKNCDEAVASVTGSGDISFKGQIENVKQTVAGSGGISVDKNAKVAFLFEDNDSTQTE